MIGILAIDPGSTQSGWALVQSSGARVRFLAAGRIASSDRAFMTLLGEAEEKVAVDLVAVEQPAGYIYDPVRGAQVVATAAISGGFSWAARVQGYEVVNVTAPAVRKAVLGKTRLGFKQKDGDMDRAIKAALPSFVDGLPPRTNEHVRDALALAVAANWMALTKTRGAA